VSSRRTSRLGVTVPFPGVSLAAHRELLSRIGALGYHDIWSSESNGSDAFTVLGAASALAPGVRLATGIVNPYTRPVGLLAQTAVAMSELTGGQFCLGLGSSTKVMVENWHGIPWEKPLATMRESVGQLRLLWSGGRLEGGFRLERLPESPIPIALGCLGAKMTALAGEIADIALITSTPVSAVAQVSSALRLAEGTAGRDRGSVELAARVWCFPGPEDAALARAREWLGQLLGSPPYIDFYALHGWGEVLAPAQEAWARGDRKLGADLIPEEFLREMILLGSPAEMKARMKQFVDDGLDTLVLAPVCAAEDLPELLRSLAPA